MAFLLKMNRKPVSESPRQDGAKPPAGGVKKVSMRRAVERRQ
jgi:hypothetical protein